MRVALTIAGSDSGGGAGIQADLKSFHANGVFGASVITAITAQNTVAVTAVYPLPVGIVTAQLDAVCSDIQVHAVKVGMLANRELIAAVAAGLVRHHLHPVVVDPVMISKGGHTLLEDDAVDALCTTLLPLATLCTPNAHEAARLAGFPVETLDDALRAARVIHGFGAKAVLVKGGHMGSSGAAVDLLFDGHNVHTFRAPRLDTPHTHGTGCTYASAIAARMARGLDLLEAVAQSKKYITGAISGGFALGAGHGPTDHFWFARGSRMPFLDD